jgi:hypothetical protein
VIPPNINFSVPNPKSKRLAVEAFWEN